MDLKFEAGFVTGLREAPTDAPQVHPTQLQ